MPTLCVTLLRGGLTALAVAVVLHLLRRAGPRAGGLAAALPMTSLPALAWSSIEQGPAFTAAAAAAALLTTAMTGVFALLFAHAAGRWPPRRALVAALLPGAGLIGLASCVGGGLCVAAGGTAAVLLACRALMPAAPATPAAPVRRARHDLAATACVAGIATALIGSLAHQAPPMLCGMVAAIPVIGISTTLNVHRQAGGAAVAIFLRGYLQGLWAKAGFLALLAGLLPHGPSLAAWTAAVAGAAAIAFAPSIRNASSPLAKSSGRALAASRQ